MSEEKKDGNDTKLENSDETKPSTNEETSKPDRKKYADWPVREIKEPHDNDVLYGRGGGTNHHPGNKRYRKMVEDRKIDYVNCKRLDKPLVALGIIREWRGQDPPGRFLKLDEKTGLWFDVGDKKAREKTSQALREKAPLIRQQQEQDRQGRDGEDGENSDSDDEEDETTTKATRFAAGTNLNGNDSTKPILARDHSLGREYLEPNEAMTLEGFSWREPLTSEDAATSDFLRASSIGSYSHHSMPPPMYPPSSRIGSHSSIPTIGSIPLPGDPYRYSSHGSMGPPPPPLPHPNSYEHATSGDRNIRYPSWCRYDSWGSASGAQPVPAYSYPPSHTMSWSREHSLGQNPLSHASVSQPAYPNAFDARTGTWGSLPPPPPHYYTPTPDGPQSHYNSGVNNGLHPSEMSHPHYRHSHSPQRESVPDHYRSNGGHPHKNSNPQHYSSSASSPPPPTYYPHSKDHTGRTIRHVPDYSKSPIYPTVPARPQDHPKSPSYAIDPMVASQWSGQDPRDIAITMSGGSEDQDKFALSPKSSFQGTAKVPKPDVVKRATSNQNETIETKPDLRGPSVKRAALNRDNSMASNRLKEQYIPGYFDSEKEVKLLSANLEQSTIGTEAISRPFPISNNERTSTIENIAMDLMVRPVNIASAGRSSTIDALALDFDDDLFERSVQLHEPSMEEVVADLKQPVPRPAAITASNRLTTTEFLDLVNEPIEEDDDDFGAETESI